MNKEICKAWLLFIIGCIGVSALAGGIWALLYLWGIKSLFINLLLSVGLMLVYGWRFKQSQWGKILKF